MISKNRICDITKSWRFFGITFFFFFIYITKSIFFYAKKQKTKNKKKTKKKKKTGLFFDICDIKNRFAYIKFDFVISQSVHTGLFQDFINNNL